LSAAVCGGTPIRGLESGVRKRLVRDLMASRRAVRTALADADVGGLAAARRQVDAAKVGPGERGPVWWDDGAPDLNRHMARNTPYADGFAALEPAAAGPAKPDVRTPDAGS
jgi:hypothetical protein